MKTLYSSLIALFILVQAKGQNITGSYEGSISFGGKNLHLVFNLKSSGDSLSSATFDSPDQMAFGIPCSKYRISKDSVFVEIAKAGITYKGLWNGKEEITGTFLQGTTSLPLNVQRLHRPQTPQQPFGYHTEDVEYDNADKSLHYGATFTRPEGKGKYPAVIIITGSGTQDRDGTLFGHRLYWVLADYLTKNGIAVLRVDDRGAGKSSAGSNSKNATSLDFSYDVEASLNYLESRQDVNKKHLGLIGHSEGGIIAPMVAARRSDVNFIVMWGAPETGGALINSAQNGHALKNAGIDSIAVAAFLQLHKQVLALFTAAANSADLDQKIIPLYDAWKKAQSKKTLDALYVHDNSIVGKDITNIYNGLFDLPWMRFFITYDPRQDLSKVKCAVLAINGQKDTQVSAGENLTLIKWVLIKSGNRDFEVRALPGLNHLLQTADTGELAEYGKIEETMSPAALNIICNWIKLHTK